MIPLLIAMVDAKAQKSALDTWIQIFQNMFLTILHSGTISNGFVF
jgi:hypothetical protein